MKTVPPLLAVVLVAAHPARAADWTVQTDKSGLGFSGVQTGAAFHGKFTKWSAQISFDPDHPEAGHAVVIVDLATAHTGDAQRDTALPQAEWFNIKAFPQARFEATSFRADHAPNAVSGAYEAVGKLTIRGVTQDIVLPFTLAITGDSAAVHGRLPLIRTGFGIGQGPWSTGEWVALEVDVDIDLVASKAGG